MKSKKEIETEINARINRTVDVNDSLAYFVAFLPNFLEVLIDIRDEIRVLNEKLIQK